MIVSNNSVNDIALSYVWQLTDNYVNYLQTNTLSQMVVIHSWPDFDDLPRGHEANISKNEASVARGQGRGRGKKIWPWGRVGLEDWTSLLLWYKNFCNIVFLFLHYIPHEVVTL